jgi:tetratricopeptide (TPR) repeat protein
MDDNLDYLDFNENTDFSQPLTDDFYDGCEAWGIYAELFYAKNYQALVEYCKREVKRNPDDPYSKYRLGEAYVLNGQYKAAIDFMGTCHREVPEHPSFQHIILDALFALGKTEDDFAWLSKPKVLRLNSGILDQCYGCLLPKRKPRDVEDLRISFMADGYVTFSHDDFVQALTDDGRFIVEDADSPYSARVRVRRQKDR